MKNQTQEQETGSDNHTEQKKTTSALTSAGIYSKCALPGGMCTVSYTLAVKGRVSEAT